MPMKIALTLRMIIAALGFTALALPAYADEAAENHVQAILDEAAPALEAESREEMLDGIAAIVDKHVDLRRVARFTLGQYARQLTDEQRKSIILCSRIMRPWCIKKPLPTTQAKSLKSPTRLTVRSGTLSSMQKSPTQRLATSSPTSLFTGAYTAIATAK